MKSTKSGKALSKIGIGTWGIGGVGHRDMKLTDKKDDKKYIEAISYTLNKGSNFAELSAGYGHGNSMRLFAMGLEQSEVSREDVFLTNSLYPRDLPNLEAVKKDIEYFYTTFTTDYADSTLITQSFAAKFGQDNTFKLLQELLNNNKTRYLSISNSSPAFIKEFKNEFGDKVFAHEGHISFEVRAYQDKGVFKMCEELDIVNIIWKPLRTNMTQSNNWELLTKLAQKYNKTQNQIILNWICSLNYYPMVMSSNKAHIDENIESLEFKMTETEYDQITNFRPDNYSPPEIDWEHTGNGVSIVNLVMNFEKHLNRK